MEPGVHQTWDMNVTLSQLCDLEQITSVLCALASISVLQERKHPLFRVVKGVKVKWHVQIYATGRESAYKAYDGRVHNTQHTSTHYIGVLQDWKWQSPDWTPGSPSLCVLCPVTCYAVILTVDDCTGTRDIVPFMLFLRLNSGQWWCQDASRGNYSYWTQLSLQEIKAFSGNESQHNLGVWESHFHTDKV